MPDDGGFARACDRYLAATARVIARRRKMRTLIVASGFGVVVLAVDAALLWQVQSMQGVQEWWPQLVAAALALIAFASLRATVQVYQKYTDARVALLAEKREVDLVRNDIEELRKEWKEFRHDFNAFLIDQARRGAAG